MLMNDLHMCHASRVVRMMINTRFAKAVHETSSQPLLFDYVIGNPLP